MRASALKTLFLGTSAGTAAGGLVGAALQLANVIPSDINDYIALIMACTGLVIGAGSGFLAKDCATVDKSTDPEVCSCWGTPTP